MSIGLSCDSISEGGIVADGGEIALCFISLVRCLRGVRGMLLLLLLSGGVGEG